MKSNTLFNLPIRFDYYQYSAETWAQVFSNLKLDDQSQVCELGSGWSPKIALGLLLSDFQGNYTACDKSQTSLDQLKSLMAKTKPKFKISTNKLNILNDRLPKSDVFILNHVLDDILLDLVTTNQASGNTYHSIQNLKKLWESTEKSEDELIEKNLPKLATQLAKSLKPKGHLLIAQYPGYQEKLYKLNEAVSISWEFARGLKDNLIKKYSFIEGDSRKFITNPGQSYFQPKHLIHLTSPAG